MARSVSRFVSPEQLWNKGKLQKKIVPFSRVSTLREGRGSAGLQIDTKLFYDLFFCWNVPEMV